MFFSLGDDAVRGDEEGEEGTLLLGSRSGLFRLERGDAGSEGVEQACEAGEHISVEGAGLVGLTSSTAGRGFGPSLHTYTHMHTRAHTHTHTHSLRFWQH